MHGKQGSSGLRLLAILLLAAGGLPLAFGWYEARSASALVQENVSVPPGQTDSASITPNEIDVQLKPGADESTLAELSKKIGATFAWNSPVSRDETDVADAIVPAGTDEQADLDISAGRLPS